MRCRDLRRDRGRQDHAAAGVPLDAARPTRGSPSSRTPASSTSPTSPNEPRQCSSGRRASRTSRASVRSASATCSATPCGSTLEWLIVGECRDGPAAREMLLAMQHGHPSMSTVHHHSATSAWKKLAQYLAQGAEAVEFDIAALLISDAVDFFIHLDRDSDGPAGRVGGVRGRRMERCRGPAQPDLRPRRRRSGAAAAPSHRPASPPAGRGRTRRRPADESGRMVAMRPVLGALLGAGVALGVCSSSPPPGSAPCRRPVGPARRRRDVASRSACVFRSPLAAVLAPRWRGGHDGRSPCCAAAPPATDGAVAARCSASGGNGSWPGPRRSPCGRRCSATCSSPTPGCGRRSPRRPGSPRRRSPPRCRALDVRAQRGELAPALRTIRRRRRRRGRRHRRRRAAARRTAGGLPTSVECSPPPPRPHATTWPCNSASTLPAPGCSAPPN